MRTQDKRSSALTADQVQEGSKLSWSQNSMVYDRRKEHTVEPFTPAWFDRADAVFFHAARLLAREKTPFDRIIPLEKIRGKCVLEIGRGMELHSEIMARAGKP